jgi:hypothetical protein
MCTEYCIKIHRLFAMLLLGLNCQFKIDRSQMGLAAFHVASHASPHTVLILGVDSTLREINLKRVVSFSTSSFRNSFRLDEHWWVMHEMRAQKHVNCPSLFSDFNQIGMCQQILVKSPYVIFYKNLFSSFRVSTLWSQVFWRDQAHFLTFHCECKKKNGEVYK